MSNFHDQYKRRPGGFNDVTTGRVLRAGDHEERRRVHRAENFLRYRDVSTSPEKTGKKTADVEARLRKWRQERALKKKIEQRKKKPPFKVGVMHHRFYSPTADDAINKKFQPCHTRGAPKIKNEATPPRRITRATEKRLEAKKAAIAASGITPLDSVSARSTSQRKRPRTAKKEASFAPANYTFKGPSGIKEIPMFGRFAIDRDSSSRPRDIAEASEPEKPWPTTSGAIDETFPQNLRGNLIRQTAVESPIIADSKPDARRDLAKIFDADSSPAIVANDDAASSKTPESASSKTPKSDSSKMPKSDSSKMPESDSSKTPESVTTEGSSDSPAPATFSPYVTTSRGKESARRERRSKMGIDRGSPDDIPTKATIMKSLNISVEEEERTAQYFKFILQREIERLDELCAQWERTKSDIDVTEDARYLINQAIGQTRLLVRKKFERFRGLVLDCETGKGEMLVQCRDLQGFWDLMYMEVEDCESRFRKLEILRSKNWIEDEIVAETRKPARKKAKSKIAANAKSSARSWILARKKKMLEAESTVSEDINVVVAAGCNEEASRPSTSGTTEIATRETTMGSRGARKSPRTMSQATKATNMKRARESTPASLLKRVQLSEASKNIRSPLAVMKISKMCKTPEVKLDDTISYVNSDQTPGKGILKKFEETTSGDSAMAKSARKVDFHADHVDREERKDENLENSIDLGRALARIDSYESDESDDDAFETMNAANDNVTIRRAEKRLDFENESLNETENTDIAESSTIFAATPDNSSLPVVKLTAPTPSKYLASDDSVQLLRRVSKRRPGNIAESVDDENPIAHDDTITRVLRSRTVAANMPDRNNRSKSSPLVKKFVEPDSSIKENDDPRIVERNVDESKLKKIPEIECVHGNRTKIRRSTRKSVRFNAEDCSACADSVKVVHPMTPHTRHSRKVSLLGDNTRQSVVPLSNGDLMSFDSPSATVVPSRVRRASQATK